MRNSNGIISCLWAALSATLPFTACQKSTIDIPEDQFAHPFEIAAKMDSSTDTKVSMSDDLTLSWDKVIGSENIWIVAKDKVQGAAFELVKVDGETAVFGLTNTGSPFENVFSSALDFNAVYPYTYGASGWMRSLTFDQKPNAFLCDISDRQVIKDGDNMDKDNLLMLASNSRTSASDPAPVLQFKNAVSLLSFTVESSDITRMVVSVDCDLPTEPGTQQLSYYQRRDMIAGPACVFYPSNWQSKGEDWFGAYLVYSNETHRPSYIFNSITVTREGGQPFEAGRTYYIPVWPGTKSGFSATAYHSDGTAGTTKSRESFTCVRSMVHDMKAF